MTEAQKKTLVARELFERRIRHKFDVDGAALRTLGKLNYQGKP